MIEQNSSLEIVDRDVDGKNGRGTVYRASVKTSVVDFGLLDAMDQDRFNNCVDDKIISAELLEAVIKYRKFVLAQLVSS